MSKEALTKQEQGEPVAYAGVGGLLIDDQLNAVALPVGTRLYTTPQQRKPMMDWVGVEDRLPEAGGYYLVTVATDDGPHVDVLLFDAKRKHWEHEGEPTFCHSYYFEPTHWAMRPEAAHGIKE